MMQDNKHQEVLKEAKGKNSADQGQNLPKDDQVDETSVAGQEEQSALKDAVEQINNYVQNIQRDIQFTMDDSTGETVIKVMDSHTDELVRQIPSEVALNLAKNLQKYGQLIKLEV